MNVTFAENMKCWGNGQYGKTGYGDSSTRGDNPGEMGDNLPFIDVGTGFEIEDFRAHLTAVLVKSTSGQFKSWGYGSVSLLMSDYQKHSYIHFIGELSEYI